MSNTTYGYIRVSSKDQNEARQMIAMQTFGVDEHHINIENSQERILIVRSISDCYEK